MWQQVIENKLLEQSYWRMTDIYLDEAERELSTVVERLESLLRTMEEFRVSLEGTDQPLQEDSQYLVEAIA